MNSPRFQAICRSLSAIVLGLAGFSSLPANADDLPFSANCQNYATIDAGAPYTGIMFRKNPNSPATRAATATIFQINGLNNITIPAAVASCFYTVAGTDNYCFQATNNAAAFQNINAVPGTNTIGAPACQ
jgi:hypothetical protein